MVISPWQVAGQSMGEPSGRTTTLLRLDLQDNSLGYRPLDELSSLRLLSLICRSAFHTYCQVAAVPTSSSLYYPKRKGCLRHMGWILSKFINTPNMFRSSPMTPGWYWQPGQLNPRFLTRCSLLPPPFAPGRGTTFGGVLIRLLKTNSNASKEMPHFQYRLIVVSPMCEVEVSSHSEMQDLKHEKWVS
jgi:hypothetical protein